MSERAETWLERVAIPDPRVSARKYPHQFSGGQKQRIALAAALCHDEEIVESFDDGILWVTLGQHPNVMSGLVRAYAAVTSERPGFAGEEDAAFQLGQKLEDRTCLLVIDDVWDESTVRPFLRGGKAFAKAVYYAHSGNRIKRAARESRGDARG